MHQFTGKERDSESGLDYFGARYYGAALGRFASPDPANAGAHYEDPQSWNAYAYVRNSPLALIDPDGENYTVCDNHGQNCADLTDKQFQQYLNDNQNVSKGGDGTLTYYDDNGASHNIGTASYYNEKAFDGTAVLTYLIKEDLKNAAFQVAGGLLGRAVGAFMDARSAAGAVQTATKLGDLTPEEVAQIQKVVNEAGRPIEVVGSAAKGARTAASDIDYVAPPSSHPYFQPLQEQLPGVDPGHGIVPGTHNPYIGPAIRFEPGAAPRYIPMADLTK